MNKKKVIAFDVTLATSNDVHGIANVESMVKSTLDNCKDFTIKYIKYTDGYYVNLVKNNLTIEQSEINIKHIKFYNRFKLNFKFIIKLLFFVKFIFLKRNSINIAKKKAKLMNLYKIVISDEHILYPVVLNFFYNLIGHNKRTNAISTYNEALSRYSKRRDNVSEFKHLPLDLSDVDIYFNAGLVWDQNIEIILNEKAKYKFKIGFLLYDLTPIRNSESAHAVNRFADYLYYVINSDFIITDSSYVKKDLIDFVKENFGIIDENKIFPVQLAIKEPNFNLINKANLFIFNKYKLQKNNYAVICCTIEPRKNHRLLVQIWREMYRSNRETLIPLVIVGGNGWLSNDLISELNMDIKMHPYIIHLGRLLDNERDLIISNARFSLFPSFGEGFGMPVAESLKLGTPVISSNNSSMPEAGQELTELIDVIDTKKWYETILEYITNDELIKKKKEQIAKAKLRRIEDFDRDVISVFKKQ